MSNTESDSTGLDRLLVDEDERPDEIDLDQVTIETAEFHDRLERIADAADAIDTLATDLRSIRQTGLTDDDVVSLLYGRNSGLNKGTIETTLATLDDLEGRLEGDKRSPKRDLLLRLVSDLGGLGKRETDDVFDELERLHRKYGEP